MEPPERLILEARARPFGRARVVIDVRPSDNGTSVTLNEAPSPGTLMRRARALVDPLIYLRNRRALGLLKGAVEQEARLPHPRR